MPGPLSSGRAAAIEDPRRLGVEIVCHKIGSSVLTLFKPDQALTSSPLNPEKHKE
jgi:hypothetical protein